MWNYSMVINGEFTSFVDVKDGHWLWLGKPNRYGTFYPCRDERWVSAHRYSYDTYVGPIPKGYIVHHKCGIKGCVNPEHLEALSYKEHFHKDHWMDPVYTFKDQ